jgi:hypothetical protein
MRRRKLDDLKGKIRPQSELTGNHASGAGRVPGRSRFCRNPHCTRGDDGGPGSLAHLRADARYCGAACKKAVQRSPNLKNQALNRPYLCGSKRGQSGSLRPPYQSGQCLAQNASNREVASERRHGRPQFVASADDREATCTN